MIIRVIQSFPGARYDRSGLFLQNATRGHPPSFSGTEDSGRNAGNANVRQINTLYVHVMLLNTT